MINMTTTYCIRGSNRRVKHAQGVEEARDGCVVGRVHDHSQVGDLAVVLDGVLKGFQDVGHQGS